MKNLNTAKEVLEAIDTFMSTASFDEGRRLWDVLVALRGPDTGEDDLKFKTTCHIRQAAFPKTATGNGQYVTGAYMSPPPGLPFADPIISSRNIHFLGHIYSAARALRSMGHKL